MKRVFKTWQILGVGCTFVLLVLLSRSCTPASASSGLEARISRLEAENFQLRAQLSRVETQINRLAGVESRSDRATLPNRPSPPNALNVSPRSLIGDDPMFKRLATLVIELKERVARLENRLKKLEPSPPRRN